MPAFPPLPSRFCVDDLVVDCGLRQVERDGAPINMGGLTFEFLVTLSQSAPNLVTYETLADQVWEGRPVTPETIAQRAKMLRDALDDDASTPRYVAPIRGQGYRLIAKVSAEKQNQQHNSKKSTRVIASALLVLFCSALALTLQQFNKKDNNPSLAVLPFIDMSETGDQKFLADGIAEEIINQMARFNNLDVVSRTESFYYPQSENTIESIGEKLGVTSVLEGSIQRDHDKIKITVQLVNTENGYQIWSEIYNEEINDIFVLQNEIASQAAAKLGVTLGIRDANQFEGAGTNNLQAYEALLSGEFQTAIDLDPNYASAWAARGIEIASGMWDSPPVEAPEIIQRALEHVSKAVELDPNSAQAHSEYATLIYTTWHWNQAEESYRRARNLWHSEFVLNHHANMLVRSGRSTEALQTFQERDNAMRIPMLRNEFRLYAQLATGDFEKTKELVSQFDTIQGYSQLWLALNNGTEEEVLSAIDLLPKNSADFKIVFEPLKDKLNNPEQAIASLKISAQDSTGFWNRKYQSIALAAAYFGEPEFAFDVLNREIQYTPIRFGTLWFPIMSEVRQLPEFKQFLLEKNLPDYWRTYGWPDHCRPISEDDFVCD